MLERYPPLLHGDAHKSMYPVKLMLDTCAGASAWGGFQTFAGARLDDKVAPIADLPALALERRGSTEAVRRR